MNTEEFIKECVNYDKYVPILGLYKGKPLEYNVCKWWDGRWHFGLLKLESFYNNVATYNYTGRNFVDFEDARDCAILKHCAYYAIPYKINDYIKIYGFDFKFD